MPEPITVKSASGHGRTVGHWIRVNTVCKVPVFSREIRFKTSHLIQTVGICVSYTSDTDFNARTYSEDDKCT